MEVTKKPFMTVLDKATKSDDAPAPVHLFDDRIHASLGIAHERRPRASEALEVLRKFGLRLWKRRVRASFSEWLKRSDSSVDPDRRVMIRAGWDACRQVDDASCWDWDAGLALLFWRWPEDYQRESWEGVPPRVVGELPLSKSPSPHMRSKK